MNATNDLLRALGKAATIFPLIFKPMISIRGSGLRIVYYHMIGDREKEYYTSKSYISVDDFQKQIDFLKYNFQYISLSNAISKYYSGENLDGYFTITTDDGFQENYTDIAPMLIENDLRATIFLVTNCIDNKNLMWRNKLHIISKKIDIINQHEAAKACGDYFKINSIKKDESLLRWSTRTWPMNKKDKAADFIWDFSKLERLDSYLEYHEPYLNTNQINELIDNGFDIGSHSKSHPYFGKLTYMELCDEILGSINYIKENFSNKGSNILSLPFGNKISDKNKSDLLKNYPNDFKSILGIHSAINNNIDPTNWQRDLFELDYHLSIGTFTIIPIIRKMINLFR